MAKASESEDEFKYKEYIENVELINYRRRDDKYISDNNVEYLQRIYAKCIELISQYKVENQELLKDSAKSREKTILEKQTNEIITEIDFIKLCSKCSFTSYNILEPKLIERKTIFHLANEYRDTKMKEIEFIKRKNERFSMMD